MLQLTLLYIRVGIKKFTVVLQADFRILQATTENTDNKTEAICFDYVQNLPLPHTCSGSFLPVAALGKRILYS